MNQTRSNRLMPLFGILAAVLWLAGILVSGSTPDTNSSGADVLSYYSSNDTSQQVAGGLFGYGALFFILFAGVLRSRVRRAGNETVEGPATLAFGGALVMATGVLLLAGVSFAIASEQSSLDAVAAQALNVLSNEVWMPFIVGQAVFMLGAGVAVRRGDLLPSWLGWAAIILGVISATPVGWFGIFLVLLWTAVVSVLLMTRSSASGAEGPTAPVPSS